MKSNTLLSKEQTNDLKKRLASFQKKGILPASQAYSEFKDVITSSERSVHTALCVNVADLKQDTVQGVCDTLLNHESHGFLNMALERHNFLECKNQDDFRVQTSERLNCSLVFIIDIKGLGKPSNIGRKKELDLKRKKTGVAEYMLNTGIATSNICGILAPEGIEEYVKEAFGNLPIYTAPLKMGNLTLSSFTLSSAICSANGESGVNSVMIPDYEEALKEFIKMNPARTQFATHITRFATQHDLLHPFTLLTEAEHSIREMKIAKQMFSLVMSKNRKEDDTCRFVKSPSTGVGYFLQNLFKPALEQKKLSREVRAQVEVWEQALGVKKLY